MRRKSENVENLTWELPRVESDAGSEIPADDRLRDYREGRLSELEQRRIEWALSRSARARARLVRLAGVELPRPRASVRRRVLGRPRISYWKVAAAVLVVGLVGAAGWRLFDDPSRSTESLRIAALPADLEYDVRVTALASRRGGSDGSLAKSSTLVRIVLEPRQHPVAGLEFALYQVQAGSLRRLVPGEDVEVIEERGAATLAAEAASLVGAAPGTRDFFVLIAPAGALPAGGPLSGVRPAEWLADVSGGRVYRRSLTVVDER